MKLTFTFLFSCLTFANLIAQGFGNTPTNWPVPQGGHTYSSLNYGYDDLYNYAVSNSPIGDHTWSVIDINGDRKPDLVITAESKAAAGFANQPTAFGQPGSFYWKVHLNNGNGFSSTSINWPLPQGGHTYQTINYGFDAIAASAESTIGDQTWSLVDMNNDNKPDLVVTAERRAFAGFSNQATIFGTPTNSYWKVYLNTGTGFNTTPINWTVPQGGHTYSTIYYGFDALAASADSQIGDQTWSIMDMNNDNKPDLVVMAERKAIPGFANLATVFGTPTNSYWKVYLNTGSGFNTTPITWTLPQGGHISSSIYYGFDKLGGSAGATIGDQSWGVIDINNDNKPDLVVTAQTKEFTTFSNQATVFGTTPTNSYWKVYLNTGSGFNTTPINWTLPQGGHTYSTIYYGYDALADSADSQIGDQTWSVMDMNSDNKPDLVVLAQRKEIAGFSNQATVFGTPTNSYWKVYLNNGSGFNTTPNNWSLPQGGHSYSTIYYGYDALGDDATNDNTIGNQTWSVLDMNNDSKPDLVVTAESREHLLFANQATVFGLPASPYWKVYFNNSTLQIDDFTAADRITVFPNPSNGQFHIQTENTSENVNVAVYDLAGRKMLQQDATTLVDLSGFPKGMYLLNIQVGEEMHTKKVILK